MNLAVVSLASSNGSVELKMQSGEGCDYEKEAGRFNPVTISLLIDPPASRIYFEANK
ncbi:hypothetical protein BFJ66_g17969 [Fusarium oxysporum f. sp. cepae]|nr:hypothetical protein BFJ66_g17969 [Fusarium oxysporum f. sp. cepae]